MSGRRKSPKEKLAEPMHCWVNREEADRIHREVRTIAEQHGIDVTVSDVVRKFIRLGIKCADQHKDRKP